MQDIMDYVDKETSYVGKINQNDISIPVSYAAVGNENYIDIYNTTRARGYSITTDAPGIFAKQQQGTPTGFAANLPNKTFTRQELEQISDYYADQYNVPKNLARALIKQESGWNPKAKSKVGAIGMTQLMPATAKGLGVTDIWDPAQNIEGGMKYLSTQYKRFGNWESALAAYNAGPGAVADYLEGTNKTGQNPLHRKGVAPWAGTGYKETKNYVKNIMAMAKMNAESDSYPVYFSLDKPINQKQYINNDTGLLSTVGLDNFIDMINNDSGYKDNVKQVLTNRPELLENKPEYSDFAKYRKMKTAEGKPLFAKADFNGFQVMIKAEKNKQGLNRNAIPAIADDMVNTQTDIIKAHGRDLAESLLETFANRYGTDTTSNSRFGLANLTSREYEEYGVPVTMQQNPVLQARVLQQEFQRAYDILGSENKAIYALAGGKLRNDYGEIKSWEEIKQDRENFMKRYFIQPAEDNKTRTAVNNQVQIFNALYRKHKGIA